MKKRILICNLASPANPGDQAILRGTLKLIHKYQPQCEVTVSTRAYSERSVYEALGCKVVPSYPDVDCMAMNDSFKKVMKIPQAMMRPGVLAKAVKSSDVVLLAGGAYFYSYRKKMPGLTYLAHVSPVCFAKKYHKPVTFLPQSYGPFYSESADRLFRYSVDGAENVYYREDLTGEWLKQKLAVKPSKCRFMPDLALYLRKEDLLGDTSAKTDNRMRIGLTLRPWSVDNKDAASYYQMLAAEIGDFAARHDCVISVIVQVMDAKDSEGDEQVSRQLAAALKQKLQPDQVELHVRQPYFELEELCGLYAACDGLIGMRLHSALLSYIVGVPAAVVGYQHKAEGILKALRLDDMYLGSYDAVNQEAVRNYLSDLLNKRQALSDNVERQLDLARANIEQEGQRFLT